jgi:penicillin-binding protein 1A
MVAALQHVGALNDMLNAVLVSGTGKRAALATHPAGGKTGTTQDFRDAWFVGYTAHYIGGVWVGNDDRRPMNNVMGGGLPSKLWHEVMTVAHEGMTPTALPGTMSAPLVSAPFDEAERLIQRLKGQPRRPPPSSGLRSAGSDY